MLGRHFGLNSRRSLRRRSSRPGFLGTVVVRPRARFASYLCLKLFCDVSLFQKVQGFGRKYRKSKVGKSDLLNHAQAWAYLSCRKHATLDVFSSAKVGCCAMSQIAWPGNLHQAAQSNRAQTLRLRNLIGCLRQQGNVSVKGVLKE